jgi:hypothetical protein
MTERSGATISAISMLPVNFAVMNPTPTFATAL